MSGRDSKVKKLREHIDIAHRREINSEERKARRELSSKEKEKLRSKWIESAERIDKNKLHEVWNK